MTLRLVPRTRDEAKAFIALHHRHNRKYVGDKFRVGAAWGDEIVGVAVAGKPTSRIIQQREPQTVELIRLCVRRGAPRNTLRTLHAAILRAAWALGYTRVISYTLKSESGNSMRDAGYRVIGEIKGRSWNCRSRPRIDGHAIEERLIWDVVA